LSCCRCVPARAQEAIYLVRHAERANQSEDPPLSTEGVGRSYRLRDMLKDAGITKIFTWNCDGRSRRRRRSPPRSMSARSRSPLDALAAKIAASNARDRILVVGHSNTAARAAARAPRSSRDHYRR
jgi:broad specificity phosphatase PhoE